MALQQTPELERALQLGADRKASDIYFLPNEPISLRILGELERTDGPPLSAEDVQQIASAAVGEDRLDEIGPARGRITVSCGLPGVVNGRMTIARSLGNCTIVVRILSKIPTVAWARIPDAIVQAVNMPNGLILFAGPTGSGKTTTMYSLADDINQRKAFHICTVEDPIGTVLTPKRSFIQQREVGTDCPDVIAGIAAAMSQDPDLLLVGELRSAEETQSALYAVNTGHLVFTQVHAFSPEAAIQKLIDVQPPENLTVFRRDLAGALGGATVQRILPLTGGKGRRPAYGVIIPDDEMRQAIAQGRNIFDRVAPLPKGCQTLAEDIETMRREGLITDEVAQKALETTSRRYGG